MFFIGVTCYVFDFDLDHRRELPEIAFETGRAESRDATGRYGTLHATQ